MRREIEARHAQMAGPAPPAPDPMIAASEALTQGRIEDAATLAERSGPENLPALCLLAAIYDANHATGDAKRIYAALEKLNTKVDNETKEEKTSLGPTPTPYSTAYVGATRLRVRRERTQKRKSSPTWSSATRSKSKRSTATGRASSLRSTRRNTSSSISARRTHRRARPRCAAMSRTSSSPPSRSAKTS